MARSNLEVGGAIIATFAGLFGVALLADRIRPDTAVASQSKVEPRYKPEYKDVVSFEAFKEAVDPSVIFRAKKPTGVQNN